LFSVAGFEIAMFFTVTFLIVASFALSARTPALVRATVIFDPSIVRF
jgi:hypothetical protein